MVGVIFSGGDLRGPQLSHLRRRCCAATFTGADLIDHVRTQIYYAATVGLVSVALLLVGDSSEFAVRVCSPIGVLTLVALVYLLLPEFDARRRGIDPVSVSGAAGRRRRRRDRGRVEQDD